VAFFCKYSLSSDYIYFLDASYYNHRVDRDGSVTGVLEKKRALSDDNVQPAFEDIYAHAVRWGMLDARCSLLSAMLVRLLQSGLRFSGDADLFLKQMRSFIAQYNLPDTPAHTFRYLLNGSDFIRFKPLSPLEKVLSVVNERSQNKKIFRILGWEFAIDKR
jgi:hypothetical protein